MDERSSSAKAMSMVIKITTIGLTTVIPTVIGYFVDQWLECSPIFTILGMLFGVIAGGWQLYGLVLSLEQQSLQESNPVQSGSEQPLTDQQSNDDVAHP